MTTHSAAPSGASPLRAWLAVGAVTLAAFAFVTTEFLPVGLLPAIAQEVGVQPGTAGLMVTIPGLLAAVAAPGLMLGAGRIDRRLILLVLSVLLVASNLISAFASSFPVMLLGRALLGASLGGFWTLALAVSSRLVRQQDMARATATIMGGVTCATVIGVPLGTFIASLASWRVSFMATGALAAVSLVAQWMLVPALPSKAALRMTDLLELWRRPHPRKSLLMVLLIFAAHFSSYTYIAPFLLTRAGFSLQSITWVLLGFGIIDFVSNAVASTTVGRHLKGTLMTIVVLLMLALLALPWLQGLAPAVTAAVLAWGIAFGAIPLCMSMWMHSAAPDLPEAGSATFISIIQVAIAVGSSVGGAIVDNVGIPADFRFGFVLAVLGLLVVASFGGRAKAAA